MTKTENLRPETIEGIKRLASRIQQHDDLARNKALDAASRRAGFNDYAHARRAIETGDAAMITAARRRRDSDRRMEEFRAATRLDWSTTIDSVSQGAPSTSWEERAAIIENLRPFLGEGRNHGFFPTGGGNDFTEVRISREAGCIELMVGPLAYIARPKRLRLERIEEGVPESFVYLELDDIAPSGVYEVDDAHEPDPGRPAHARRRGRDSEELVDLGGGEYAEREVWDRGYLDHPDDPLSDSVRLIHRLLGGNIIFACKASMWNRVGATYDGRHDWLGADGVRAQIEQALRPREEN